jgi:hypothetical protein
MSHVAPAVTGVAPAIGHGAPTAGHVAPAVMPSGHAMNPVPPPRSIAPAVITPSGVRVQRYQPAVYPRPVTRYGMWERLRRVLFGVTN